MKYALRPATDADTPFLRDLFVEGLPAELRAIPLPPEQKAALIEMQFQAQARDYESRFPDALHEIVEVDGTAVGRMWTVRQPEAIHFIDLRLASTMQGKGLGSRLFRAVIAEAGAAGLATTLLVSTSNPARALYVRLGFESRGVEGLFERMEVPAPQPVAAGGHAAPHLPGPEVGAPLISADALEGLLHYEDFAPFAERDFSVEGTEITLRLTEVRHSPWDDPTYRPPRPPFSLLFQGPPQPFFGQGLCRVVTPSGTTHEIFMVPVGQNEQGFLYESLHT